MNEFVDSDEMNEEEEKNLEQNDNVWGLNFIEEKNFRDKNSEESPQHNLPIQHYTVPLFGFTPLL